MPLVVQLRYRIAHLPTVALLQKARNHSMHTEYNLMSIGPMSSFNVRLRAMVIAGLTGRSPPLPRALYQPERLRDDSTHVSYHMGRNQRRLK